MQNKHSSDQRLPCNLASNLPKCISMRRHLKFETIIQKNIQSMEIKKYPIQPYLTLNIIPRISLHTLLSQTDIPKAESSPKEVESQEASQKKSQDAGSKSSSASGKQQEAKDEGKDAEKEREEAATRIQAAFRGHHARKSTLYFDIFISYASHDFAIPRASYQVTRDGTPTYNVFQATAIKQTWHSPFTLAENPEKKDKEDSNNISPRNHIMDIENLKVVDLSRQNDIGHNTNN
ncbi:hypothetical protein WN51_14129 [Melipona quadrifasciata]|uniref:Uncharacterized protein n=1 Tax=Melipona quadrifasciata TaxID=166423 RepID=A0A0M9A1S3_9HYME|nr:hypothetical protein WN51_14129 [Melipona quadrifasciata]